MFLKTQKLRLGSWFGFTALLAFLISLATATHHAATHPAWNLDGIFYTASMMAGASSPVDLHTRLYRELEHQIPAEDLAMLTEGSEYRRLLRTSPAAFALQLPFYRSKPLYCWIGRVLVLSGVPSVRAPYVVSAASFLLISLLLPLLAYFVGAKLSLSLLATALAVWLPELRELGTLATPDALATALLLGGTVLLLVRSRLAGALVAGAVLARPDASLLVLGVLSAMWLRESSPARRLELMATGVFVVSVAAVVIPLTDGYGWSTVVRHTFFERLTAEAELKQEMSVGLYFKALGRGLRGHMTSRHPRILPYGLAAIVVSYLCAKRVRRQQDPAARSVLFLIAGIWGATIARFLVVPLAADRFFAPAYLFTLVFVCLLCAPRKRTAPG